MRKWQVLFLCPSGGHPCCFCEAGEEAQNSGPRAQWLGYHHRHRPEGKHFHHSRCELKYLCWLLISAAWPRVPGEVWWKKQHHAIDRSRVESQHGGARERRVFPPLRQRSAGLLNFLPQQTQPVIEWCFQRHDVLFSFCPGPNNAWIMRASVVTSRFCIFKCLSVLMKQTYKYMELCVTLAQEMFRDIWSVILSRFSILTLKNSWYKLYVTINWYEL